MPAPKNHTPGQIRYFTYHLIFPGDNDHWIDQTPFVHPLDFQLKQTVWARDPMKIWDLLHKGETHWKDHNGITHRIVIEATKRNRKWGTKKNVH